MPSPVDFTISLAPLPPNFVGTPQQLADAIAARLTVTPSEPWSAVQVSSSVPTSNLGPLAFEGREWRMWSESAGAYVPARLQGSGLIAKSVADAALADGTVNSLRVYGADGRPAVVNPPTSSDQFLGYGADGPAWRSAITRTAFEATPTGGDQSIPTTDTITQILFNSTKFATDVTYDGASCRVNVTAGSLWFFYASLQLADTATSPSTEVGTQISIKPTVATGLEIGSFDTVKTMHIGGGVKTSGLIYFPVADSVGVYLKAKDTQAESDGLTVVQNGANTRFGGFRLA